MTKTVAGEGTEQSKQVDKAVQESIDAAVSAALDSKLKPLTESLETANTELATFKKRDAARTLLESYKTNATIVGADNFKQLCECADEPAMKTFIEALPPAMRGVVKPPMGGGGTGEAKPMPRLINARR